MRIRRVRFGKWSWVVASLTLCAVGAGIVAADPPTNKKPTNTAPPSGGTAGKATATKPGAPSPDAARKPLAGGAASTNEPIVARVNNEAITYKALAEECIARKGSDVLDTMISKMLVMQACKQRGFTVSAAEVDQEIGRTAERLKLTHEGFLKMLKEQRGLEGKQYAEDIVLPGLALKKLATPYVKVSEDDVEHGFESMYGEKVKCRWIMFDDQKNAMNAWNQLKATVKKGETQVELTEFERQVTRWSTDVGSRALGGQIQPISHHTSPRFQELEKAAFAMQEDGEISKVVQIDNAHVILYREALIPPANVKLEVVRKDIESEIYEAKLRDQIGRVFQELKDRSAIENLLTGEVSTPESNTAGMDKAGPPKDSPAKVGSSKDATKKAPTTIRR